MTKNISLEGIIVEKPHSTSMLYARQRNKYNYRSKVSAEVAMTSQLVCQKVL